MADTDSPADAATRLEQALDRIAALADQVAADRAFESVPAGAEDAVEVAERLDALIAKLRATLAGRPG